MPGSPLDPRAEGANDLLRDGATFCTKAEDVTNALVAQNLSREQPDAGFFESGPKGVPYEPLWDELDLTGAGDAVSIPADPPRQTDTAQPQTTTGSAEGVAGKPAGRPEAIEQRLAALLGPVPVPVDELARLAETPAREVRAALLALKLAGQVEWHGGDLISSLPGAWPSTDSHED